MGSATFGLKAKNVLTVEQAWGSTANHASGFLDFVLRR
jgi:hypothetical protein